MTPAAEFIFDLRSTSNQDHNTDASEQLQSAATQREIPVSDDFAERLQAVLNQTKHLVYDWQAKRASH